MTGPNPGSVKCDNSEINDFCNNFQNEAWLSTCNDKVDDQFKADLKKACVIDLCANFADSTKHEIVKTYVDFCKREQEDDFLCDWETQLSGNVPTCAANEKYEGNKEMDVL